MIRRWLRVALLSLVVATTPAGAGPRVTLSTGVIEGSRTGAVDRFLGIPYAAPPTGERRWRLPEAPPAWRGTLPATGFAPDCRQKVDPRGFGPWSAEFVVAGKVDEDCLYLNVWAPARHSASWAIRRPVLVWIHGGGFVSGSGSVPIYDGTALARQGIVVVTINYRLGPFGFPAAPPGAGSVPNAGLWDMVAALRWVRDEIARFGGDPARVTIAGQSAGAIAVHTLLAAPPARGLFARAIAESGLPAADPPPPVAAPDRAALSRHTPAETVEAVGGRHRPVVDGTLLPSSPDRAAASGRVADVPILIGLTADEASGFGGVRGGAGGWPRNCGAAAARLAPSYAGDATAMSRDCGRWALLRWFDARATTLRAPVFAYLFDRAPPGPEAERWGAFHSAEIPYAFGTLGAAPDRGYTAADRALSALMVRRWAAFVKDGRPGWPAMTRRRPVLQRLGLDSRVEPVLAPAKRRLFANAGIDDATFY